MLVSQGKYGGTTHATVVPPVIDKIFSWLQEEVSINLVNEIENCLLLRSVKVIVYGLPPEDVASYRSKM